MPAMPLTSAKADWPQRFFQDRNLSSVFTRTARAGEVPPPTVPAQFGSPVASRWSTELRSFSGSRVMIGDAII